MERKREFRFSADGVRPIVEALVPDPAERRAVLEFTAEVVRRIHGCGGSNWSVTVSKPFVTLNLGRYLVVRLQRPGVVVGFDPAALDAAGQKWLEARTEPVQLGAAPDLGFRRVRPRDLQELHTTVLSGVDAFIERANQTARYCPYTKSYSPGFLDYLEEELGEDLPRPEIRSKAGANGVPSVATFRELFEEFIEDQLEKVAGRSQLAERARAREAGRRQFDAIAARLAADEDVTDDVLLHLLAHADTPEAREAGAWTTPYAALRAPVRATLESRGWVKSEDWPRVARSVLAFYERCAKRADDLAGACAALDELPFAHGFQAGALSPLLNALDPERFLVVDSRSCQALRRFTGERFRTRLLDYPGANGALRAFVARVRDEIVELTGDETPPADLFDVFAGWLVASHNASGRGRAAVSTGRVEHWKIAPGESGRIWEQCRDGGYIAIGWDEIGDVGGLEEVELRARWDEAKEQHSDYGKGGFGQVRDFERIPEGSWIVANRGTMEVLGVGRVTGPYYFADGEHYAHRLPVDWVDVTPRPVSRPGWRRTMVRLSAEEVEELRGRTMAGDATPLLGDEAFELLGELEADPTIERYRAIQDALDVAVVQPVQELLSSAKAAIPEIVQPFVETEKRLFSAFPKNDYGRGGAWPHYWGAFYPVDGRRRDQEQLFVILDHLELGCGFATAVGEDAERQFRSRIAALPEDLRDAIETGIRGLGLAVHVGTSSKGRRPFSGLNDFMRSVGAAERTDLGIRIPRAECTAMPRGALGERIAEVFRVVLPLFVLSAVEHSDELLRVLLRVDPPIVPSGRYSIDDFVGDTGFTEERIESWMRALERKRQVILMGPPGTGKTFVAQRIAKLKVSGTQGFVDTVQFHPAYGYEDFMQGIRPRVRDGQVAFELESGVFLRFCQEALRRDGAPCVLIVDEINRGNLARVFGELMYLLEYRDDRVPLATGGQPFRIPSNVYIIGTMNTADRSIARMDHAMRRRFTFLRLQPDYEVLHAHLDQRGHDGARALVDALKTVNAEIDDPNFEIGISYFMREGTDLPRHLPDIWRGEIEPYLEEYFYDQPKRVDRHRWRRLVEGTLRRWTE